MKPRCITIIPSNCQNEHLSYINKVSIRTHQATCDSELHFVDHDILNPYGQVISNRIKLEVESLGGVYHYWKEPFNAMKYYNKFVDMTDSEYIVFATADLIFYAGWLDALISDLERNPHLASIHPFSFHTTWAEGPTYSRTGKLDPEVIELTQPSCHVCLFKRSNVYRWEESLPFHESDTDYFFSLESRGLKAGISRLSRVDHIGGAVKDISNNGWITQDHFENASQILKKKWGKE